ncbi:unnamed protein product [Boreogadus saida]
MFTSTLSEFSPLPTAAIAQQTEPSLNKSINNITMRLQKKDIDAAVFIKSALESYTSCRPLETPTSCKSHQEPTDQGRL